jgi:tRNA (cmo5U34)-methyltransferase
MKIPRDWTFKTSEIANGFDRHVREQLPWYELTTGIVSHVARHYIPHGGMVYDIGASTGNIGRAIADTLTARGARLVAIDNAESMRAKYRAPGEFTIADAATFDFQPHDLSVCFLCLMFIPPAARVGFIRRVRANLNPGGALLVFDKTESPSGYAAAVLSRLALAGKVAAGVDAKEILQKEMSLAGIQRPLMKHETEGGVEIFRFGDFAGWLFPHE